MMRPSTVFELALVAALAACTDTSAPPSGGLPGDLGGGETTNDAAPDRSATTDSGTDVVDVPDAALDASPE
jgi:hypothetical protein